MLAVGTSYPETPLVVVEKRSKGCTLGKFSIKGALLFINPKYFKGKVSHFEGVPISFLEKKMTASEILVCRLHTYHSINI